MDINEIFAMSKKNPIKMKPRQALQTDNLSQADHETPTDNTPPEPKVVPTPTAPEPKPSPQDDTPSDSATTPTTAPATASHSEFVEKAKPAVKSDVTPVDISIAGTHHRIVCPTSEISHLETAVSYINNTVRSIRQDIKGKSPTNEELLVLTCLEMYDQLKALQDSEDYYTTERDEALVLIEKLLKNAKATA
ncbi:MAG: cell division protein ZapA [Moraxella sp.]|nr:cell division protein ZapA [Moraxella sp.]